MRTLALLLGVALALGAQAQETYPSKPVRILVSFAAGGPTDQVARIMSAKLTELTGQTFLVENKTGAGGNIGADVVAKAAPDGYTLLMATVSTHAINPGLYKNCLLYTSDAADERSSVDLGGRRIIKKKK